MVTRSQLQQRPFTGFTGALRNAYTSLRARMDERSERKALGVLATTPPRAAVQGNWFTRLTIRGAVSTLSKSRPQAIQNWYEGGFPFLDGTRSWVPSIIQDARYDQNMVTRRELLRRMRYWSQNSGLCKSTLDVSRQYVIGTHAPVVTSLSSDSKWADIAEQVFGEMIAKAGLDGESLLQMLTVAHDCKKIDGDVLFIETSRRQPFTIRRSTNHETEILKSVPCFQLVEGHRIETPPSLWNQEGISIIDGVQFQLAEQKLPNGRARKSMVRQGYWVRDASNSVAMNDESFSFIPVEGSVLVFTPTRVNQVRGLSDYYAGETTLAMIEDLLKLELRAQEVQSNLTVFITNGAGQIVNDKTQATLGAMGIKISKDGAGKAVVTTNDIEKAKEVYKKVWGGETFVGRTDDTIGFLAPNRPAEATLNLWEYLINIWCASARTVRVLVFPKTTKGQGTEVRAELDKANTGFIGEFNLNWKPVMQRAWEYFIGWAKDNDERLKNAPADWKHIEVSPPRSVLVDHGYDSAAMLAELAAGVTNLHFIAQRLGTTGKKLIAAAVKDVFMLKQECARISQQPTANIQVSAEEVRQSLSDVIKNLAAMKTAEVAKANSDQLQNA
jgi:hypothetical protein